MLIIEPKTQPRLDTQAADFSKQLSTARRWVKTLETMDPDTRLRVLRFCADCFGLAVDEKA